MFYYMDVIYITLVVAGVLMLILSLKSGAEICKKAKKKQWRILLTLIVAFIFGYIWIIYYFVNNDVNDIVSSTISVILAAGGAFVYLVTQLSLKSIVEIDHFASQQKFLAERDSLTHLYNRTRFIQVLNQKVDEKAAFYLLLLDINGFKQVNDSHGHQFGDALLCSFATRLSQDLKHITELYRIDGTEFAVIIDSMVNDRLEKCLQTINTSIKAPYDVHDQTLFIKLTLGVSQYSDTSIHATALFRNADLALHEAKRTNKPLEFYYDELGKQADEMLRMHAKVKRALKADEFELYLQPIFESKSNKVHGAEALIRWQQADGSFISPEIFIGVAERNGLITEISKWVVLEALRLLKELKAAGFIGALHVNLSTKDIENISFYDFIAKLVATDPSISNSIVFEITESTMMTNFAHARNTMNNLNHMGFEFSVDDFGTGFSSLTLLKELPISQVKIDRSFIKEMLITPTDNAIVESTLFLATKLNCNVVAEGVENKATEEKLTAMNCTYLQGYYYSKPLNTNDFMAKFL